MPLEWQTNCARRGRRNCRGRPWYDPPAKLPDRPIVDAQMKMEFDTLVADIPGAQKSTVRGSKDANIIGMPVRPLGLWRLVSNHKADEARNRT